MIDPRRAFGNSGEDLAAAFLEKLGLSVLERNVVTFAGEADIVAEDKDEIVFVEVKTRQSDEFGWPEESITPPKFRRMQLTAEAILAERGWENRFWRLDVIAIRIVEGGDPEIVHLKAVDKPYGG
ncbi:MAG: YraN family protein [Candidatus Uhrbacteria bacterium]